MALDFTQLLGRPADSIKRPPSAPAGTYHGNIKNYKYEESRFGITKEKPEEKYGVVNLTLAIEKPDDTIDPDLLKDEDGKPIDLNRRPPVREMPISGGNEYITIGFCEQMGIPKTGRSLGEMIPDLVGMAVTFELTTRDSGRGDGVVYNDVRNLRPRT